MPVKDRNSKLICWTSVSILTRALRRIATGHGTRERAFTRRPVPLCMTGTLSSPVRVLMSSLVGSLQRCLLCFGRSTKPCNSPAPDWKKERETGNADDSVRRQQGGRNQTYVSKRGQIHAVARVLSQPLHQAFTGRFPVDGDDLWLRRGLGGSGGGSGSGGRCGRTSRAIRWRGGGRGGGRGHGGVAHPLHTHLQTETPSFSKANFI